MAHLDAINNGIFTKLERTSAAQTTVPADEAAWEALTYGTEIGNLRELPAVGDPANIVNVPQFGRNTSIQIQGQADAPTFEFTVNWQGDNDATIAPSDTVYGWKMTMAEEDKSTYEAADKFDTFHFLGRVVSRTVTPNLTDSRQATVTIALQSDTFGPFTIV